MGKGKIIVIEGTDCSGKQTQSELLLKRLIQNGFEAERYSFPNYDSPTGRIIAGPILGKEHECASVFSDVTEVNPKVISLYYAADRNYNIDKIKSDINNGKIVILDRYVYSNMAFQGAKFNTEKEKIEMFKWLEKLEFDFLELPRSDINIFLHMPTFAITSLVKKREESVDQHEKNSEYLKKAEDTYILMANEYNFRTIECIKNNEIRTIQNINDELYNLVVGFLK